MGAVVTLLFAASCIISDPLSHSTGTPIAGTYSVASSGEAASVDPRPFTTAERESASAWNARLVFWYEHSGWKLFTGTGIQIICY